MRAMPNLPVEVRQGMTTLFADPDTDSATKGEVEMLLLPSAKPVARQRRTNTFDHGLAGSGPAYVFLLAQAWQKRGATLGLSEAEATQLARATVAGSGALLAERPQEQARWSPKSRSRAE